MKISSTALAFLLILASAMVADSAVVVNRVPSRQAGNHGCVACSYIYNPVCGYSGITHPNSCVARCKNDVSKPLALLVAFQVRRFRNDNFALSGHSMPRNVSVSLQRLMKVESDDSETKRRVFQNLRECDGIHATWGQPYLHMVHLRTTSKLLS